MLNYLAVPLVTCSLLTSAPDVFVDQSAANCAAGTGTAVDPVCSITAAIGLASSGDTIRIAPGTYLEQVTLPFDLDLIGTSGAAVTIVDGGFGGSVITIPAAVSVGVDSLTITRGNASAGGGIKVSGALVLTNSTVINNRSENGAGIYGDMVGGGADVTISNSLITANYASVPGYNYYGVTAIGGGISQHGGSLSISNVTISENRAIGQSTYCGAPFCTYDDRGFGGGIFASSVDLTIANSTISGCKADGWYGYGSGGGIFASQCTIDITNSTLSGNISREGRSLFTSAANPGSALSSVTITADRDAGALGGSTSSSVRLSGSIELRNCLIADNSSSVLGRATSLGHNLVDRGALGVVDGVNGDLAGSLFDPVPIELLPLADNGGPTETHALYLGSVAIDAGDPVTFQPFDQRGVARPAFGLPDIGAFEGDALVPARDLCSGTGGGSNPMCADCPCNNNAPAGTIGGCLNSAGRSARITATGDTSVSLAPLIATDLRITMTGASANAFSVMYSGDAVAPGGMANLCFGFQTGVQSLAFDGLRCAIINTRRHGGRPTDSNGDVGITNNAWGGANAPPAGLAAQAGFVAGQTRFFQAEYREDSALGCMRGLNTTQAVEIVFTP